MLIHVNGHMGESVCVPAGVFNACVPAHTRLPSCGSVPLNLPPLPPQGQRTVYRLTLVKEWNTEELDAYAELVGVGKPDFIEVKVRQWQCCLLILALCILARVTIARPPTCSMGQTGAWGKASHWTLCYENRSAKSCLISFSMCVCSV